MLKHILRLHENLEEGKTIKIASSLESYETYINRTDNICAEGDILEIYRANGAVVCINAQYIVMCCIIAEF